MVPLFSGLLALWLFQIASADTNLPDGHTVQGSVTTNGNAYYTYVIQDSTHSVTISLATLYGDPDLYVSCTMHPTPTNAVWKRTEIGNETLTLTPAMLSRYHCNFNIYITVTGAGAVPGTSAPAGFIISATRDTEKSPTQVVADQPAPVFAAGTTMSYLYVLIPNGVIGAQMEFSLADVVNQGDMYIYLNQPHAQLVWPQFNCQKYSGSTGYCTLGNVIPSTYTASTEQTGGAAIVFPANLINQGQIFTIGVICKDQTSWCINTVSVSFSGAALPLALGPNQMFNVPSWTYQQFYIMFSAPADQPQPEIVVNARPLVGGAYLFASETVNPTNTSFRWTGVVGTRDTQLAVPFGQLSQKCQNSLNLGANCTLFVSLQSNGYVPSSLIMLQAGIGASASQPLQLQPGESIDVDLSPQTYGYILSQLSIGNGYSGWTVSAMQNSGGGDLWIVLGNGRRFYPYGTYDVHSPFMGGESTTYFSPMNSASVQSVSIPSTSELARLREHRCTKEVLESEPDDQRAWEGSLKDLQNVRAFVKTVLSLPEGAACPTAPMTFGSQYYCSNCEVRITLKAGTWGLGSTVSLMVDNSTDSMPLQLNQPVPGIVGPLAYDYYYLTVNLPKPTPIQFTVQKISGDPDLYINVQNPLYPYLMPSRSNYTWRSIAVGDDVLDINPNTPHYVSKGTYLIAVYGATFSLDSQYILLAQAGSQSLVRDLPVNQYQYAAIQSSQYVFFMFDPCGGGNGTIQPNGCGVGVSPNITFDWSSIQGTVSVFITNQYRPGMSAQFLPTSNNPSLTTEWSITDGVTKSFVITPTTKGYVQSKQLYTIGVLSTSAMGSTVSFRGNIVFPNVINIIQIQMGIPSGPYTVSGGTNTYFSFQYSDPTMLKDLFVGLDITQGMVDLVMAPPQISGLGQDWAPRCYPNPRVGSGPKCLGWVYESMYSNGAQIGISHSASCEPLAGPAPNTNCTSAMYRMGTWLATAYSESPSTFTITATMSDDHLTLLENSQLADATALVSICQNRDPNSGVCPPNSGRQAYAAWLYTQLSIPSPGSGALEDVQVQFNQFCLFGGCGPKLHIYATSCFVPGTAPPGGAACGALHPYPSAEFHQLYASVTQGSGVLRIPANTPCGPNIQWNGNSHDVWNDDGNTDDQLQALPAAVEASTVCQWYFGVFTGTPTNPGGQFGAFTATLTASNDGDIQVVPSACTQIGQTCPLVSNLLSSDTPTKYFDVEFNVSQTTAVTFSAIACMGIPTIYACEPGSGCSNPTHPGPGTNGASQVGNFNAQTSSAVISFRAFTYSTAYIGVSVAAGGSNPEFQLQITHGSSPVLIAPASFMAAFDNTGTLQTRWSTGMIYFSGQQAQNAANTPVEVFVFDVTVSPLPSGAQLGTSCGLEAAYFAAIQAGGASAALRKKYPIGSTVASITGLNPAHSFYVGLMMACGNLCMPPSQQHEQRVAAVPVPINVAGVSPSPLATPSPVAASSTPSASPPPPAGLSGGAVAGIVIGTLAAVGAAGGFFFFRLRRPTTDAGAMGYYEAPDL